MLLAFGIKYGQVCSQYSAKLIVALSRKKYNKIDDKNL